MKKILCVVLCLSFVIIFNSIAFAKERVVQLNVLGCRPCGAAKRIDAVMKNIQGIKTHASKGEKGHELLIVTFDDKKVTVKMIISELKKGGFTVDNKPVYLK